MSVQTLERQLSERVVERFSHACDATAVVVRVGLPALEQDQDVPPNPGHPLCAMDAQSDYCREAWQLHLAELSARPQSHWHRCHYGRLCAVVPVVCRGRCLAAAKLVCPPEESEERFAHLVGVLDTLVRDFTATEAEALLECCGEGPYAESNSLPVTEASDSIEENAGQPLIGLAMRYIKENLSDPCLTVRRVAEALAVNPSYLSHLISKHTGKRLGRMIVEQRVKKAAMLLATTDWQVKSIARETGHANPNWFSHVFQAYSGFSPNEYRARSQRSIA